MHCKLAKLLFIAISPYRSLIHITDASSMQFELSEAILKQDFNNLCSMESVKGCLHPDWGSARAALVSWATDPRAPTPYFPGLHLHKFKTVRIEINLPLKFVSYGPFSNSFELNFDLAIREAITILKRPKGH